MHLPAFLRTFAALALAAACIGTHAEIVDPAIGITFPDRIGRMALKDRHPFDDPRLGAVIRYDQADRSMRDGGLTVGVYIYDGGLPHVSDDLDSKQLRANFRQVIAEVKMMETLGKVAAVRLPEDGEHVTTLPGCGPQFLWERYEMALDADHVLTSATYLTGFHGNFVKLRVSHLKGDATTAAVAADFVARLHNVLGGCAAP